MAQSFSMKGQFWVSSITTNDVPAGQSAFESNIGYIPTVSFVRELKHNQLLDLELSYQFEHTFSGDSSINKTEVFHRYWVRYSSNKLEARLGLQKIVFGPSQVLRALSWFDTIDLKNPTGQTAGVEALRLRWFPSNSLSLWSWVIKNAQDTLSYGCRGELSMNMGEWGFTYHQDPSSIRQQIGKSNFFVASSHQRVALDYRYDGFIGFWNESTMINSDKLKLSMFTAGADYTLPIVNGLLVMTESMHIFSKKNNTTSSQIFTVFMVSLPMRMGHYAMFISELDWDENRIYNYLRWSSTYEHYSLNFILSVSPKRADYNKPVEFLPKTLSGFGTGLQFMFIYNH